LADIKPFRGVRFSDTKYADLSPVIAPPYDVISPAQYQELRDKSEHNAVQLILGDKTRGARRGAPNYGKMAQLIDQWLIDETLVQDVAPAIYLLDQEFEIDGQTMMRRAFIARLRIEAFGRGCVFPHEHTMPGPKADRLELMNATKMNMSQIFGLYSDDGEVKALLGEIEGLEPVGDGVGLDGVKNTVRVCYHGRLIEQLAVAMAGRKIIVADGHHRYETAVAYRDQCREERMKPTYQEPSEFVSIALVAMDDSGLNVQPTHRLLTEVRGLSPAALFGKAAATFEFEEVAMEKDAMLTRLAELTDRHALGIVTREGARILVRKSGRRGTSGSARDLDVHILHHEIFHAMLGLGPDTWAKGGAVRYVQSVDDCIASVSSGEAELAAIVNPTRMEEVEAIALAGGKMPPKSTYFYPKLPSGVVFNPLM
jgi:uncharacterized protein (DUF1015 family)